MTFVSSMEKPSHEKCHKQSKRGKNSLFKLTMAGPSSKGWRKFGQNKPFKTNHLLVYKHPHSSISKKPSTILGYQSVGHPELEPKKPNRLGWTRTKRCKYMFTWWAFVVLGDEPVQTRNMAPQKIWFQASLSSWLHREFQLPSTSSSH